MRYFLLAIIVGICGWFWFDNRLLLAQPVPLAFRLPYVEFLPFPPAGPRLDVLLGLQFVLGFVLAYGLGLIRRIRTNGKIRRLQRELDAKHAAMPASAPADILSTTDV